MDQNYLGVLLYCNEVRRTLGRKPIESLRKGVQSDPMRCVVANTINHGARKRVVVASTHVFTDGEPCEVVSAHPNHIRSFIDDYDGGALPDMVGAGWVE